MRIQKHFLILATTSTVFQFAYIGLIKTNSGILIWWDRTEVDENSTFPLYLDNLESTCGSLKFIENEPDPILIALYNCSANLPYICEFEGKTMISMLFHSVRRKSMICNTYNQYLAKTVQFSPAEFSSSFIFLHRCLRPAGRTSVFRFVP